MRKFLTIASYIVTVIFTAVAVWNEYWTEAILSIYFYLQITFDRWKVATIKVNKIPTVRS